MAIVQNPLTGRSKNKFANAVFTTIKGQNIVKSKPLTVSNPRTDAQQLQRQKLALLVSLAKLNISLVRTAYKEVEGYAYGANMFVKYNMPNVGGTVGNVEIENQDGWILAKGSLDNVADISTDTVTSTTVSMDWVDNTGGSSALATDQVRAVLVSATNSTVLYSTNSFARSAEGGAFTFPAGFINSMNYSTYLYTTRAAQGKNSDSAYGGDIN